MDLRVTRFDPPRVIEDLALSSHAAPYFVSASLPRRIARFSRQGSNEPLQQMLATVPGRAPGGRNQKGPLAHPSRLHLAMGDPFSRHRPSLPLFISQSPTLNPV